MSRNFLTSFLQRLHHGVLDGQTVPPDAVAGHRARLAAFRRAGLQGLVLSDNRNIRATSVALVAAAHAIFLWAWIASAPVRPTDSPTRDLQVSVISVRRPEPFLPNGLLKPAIDFVPAPDIRIEEPPAPSSVEQVNSASMVNVLAPRPDPTRPNPTPVMQIHSGRPGSKATVLLQILVLPDGSVADAKVFKTSGQRTLDAFAIEFAKANWRYIPAIANGRPIRYWTTVLVPIALT